ncbi:MAG TPA: hypothetical protein VK503_06365 [Candidatus Bathyarchaeia archaeon]|nr:hypothetical protein [Candidatus Bathyarchaeia archaeon]
MHRSLVLMSIFLLILIPNVRADYSHELQLGAWGDDGSKGNKGVSVEIQTHIYSTNEGDFQYFWVGDNLDNGAFIQFGYIYEPGYWCLRGQTVGGKFTCRGSSAQVGVSDPIWEWQYWPDVNGNDFYFEKGPANSAGLDGSWHKYSIQPDSAGGWSFVLDGREVSHITVAWTKSQDAAYFVAEKGGNTATFGRLGPVEFRNLVYLKDDGWHTVAALYASVGCAVGTDCNVKNPYGVMLEDSGVVIAGSGIHQPKDKTLLWGTLTLDLPSKVNGSVDKKYSVSGSSQVPLPAGTHTITLSPTVATDEKSRLRFDHWSDGSKSPNRTITLTTETTLTATYVTQYLLTIDSVVPLKGSGWYDKGSTVTLSAPTSSIGSQWVFDGWYKDGIYLTNSPSPRVSIDGPHSLQARWHQDYAGLIAMFALLLCLALVLILIYRVKRRKREQ